MKALTWHGKNGIRGDSVPDSRIEHGRDAIIKVTACAICDSDLHLFDGGGVVAFTISCGECFFCKTRIAEDGKAGPVAAHAVR